MYTPIVEINLSALKHNAKRVRAYAPKAAILAMVKANAYGHGLISATHALNEDIDALAVARLEEGILLRQSGIKKPIVLMGGFFTVEEMYAVVQFDLDIVVHHEFQIKLLETQRLEKKISVWIKIDTGMNRLGFDIKDAENAYQRLKRCQNVRDLKVLTHLSIAEELRNPITEQQFNQFMAVTKDWDIPKSIAKSAAIIAHPEMQLDWIRPGIMLYGVSPFPDTIGAEYQLKPVMTVRSCLVNVRQCQRGDRVGYGGHWVCPEDMLIGVISMGYGDGYPRHAPNGTPVLVNQTICGLAGRVSMDMLMVDLRSCPHAKIGDPVVLWGEGLPIEQVAQSANTIPYTLLSAPTSRVRFKISQ